MRGEYKNGMEKQYQEPKRKAKRKAKPRDAENSECIGIKDKGHVPMAYGSERKGQVHKTCNTP